MVAELEDVQRSMLLMAEIGVSVSSALAASVGGELAANAPLITLFRLDLEGPLRPGTLQDALHLTSGGVSRLVERLESAGLVERESGADPSDRRAVIVSLTPEGRDTCRRMATVAQSQLGQVRSMVASLSELVLP